jgi:hypothetical protein
MTDPARRDQYQIRVKGILHPRWADWFDGLQVETHDQDTLIVGWLPDQAALHGVLNRIRDLDLFLTSVTYLPAGDAGDGPSA